MKALVIYTTMYGNTEKVARAIAKPLKAKALSVKETEPEKLQGIDLLVVGSPTQAFNMLPVMKTWLKALPKGSLTGMKVAAFDTRMDVKKVNNAFLTFMEAIFGYAAEKIGRTLVKKGGNQLIKPEGFFVDGSEGPLTEGELERAIAWAGKLAKMK
jgi:flavodoxin I